MNQHNSESKRGNLSNEYQLGDGIYSGAKRRNLNCSDWKITSCPAEDFLSI